MRRLCERAGCGEPAAAMLAFDVARQLAWLEVELGPRELGIALCARHADGVLVPRGWWLDDRRQGAPQLFVVASDPSPVAEAAPRPRAAPPRPRPAPADEPATRTPQVEEVRLPELDAGGASATGGTEPAQVDRAAPPDDTDPRWRPVELGTIDVAEPPADLTPLLARAFANLKRASDPG